MRALPPLMEGGYLETAPKEYRISGACPCPTGSFCHKPPVTASKFIWPVIEAVALNEPFKRITSNGAIEQNLYSIEATGVSTQPWGWQLDGHHLIINVFVLGELFQDNAGVKMSEIIRHWDNTYFAWVGKTDADAVVSTDT